MWRMNHPHGGDQFRYDVLGNRACSGSNASRALEFCYAPTGTKQKTALSGIAIGVDRSHLAFRGFLPRKTTPREVYEATVIAKPL